MIMNVIQNLNILCVLSQCSSTQNYCRRCCCCSLQIVNTSLITASFSSIFLVISFYRTIYNTNLDIESTKSIYKKTKKKKKKKQICFENNVIRQTKYQNNKIISKWDAMECLLSLVFVLCLFRRLIICMRLNTNFCFVSLMNKKKIFNLTWLNSPPQERRNELWRHSFLVSFYFVISFFVFGVMDVLAMYK